MTVFLISTLFVCISCEQKTEKRHYVEIVKKTTPSEIMMPAEDPHAGIPGFEQMKEEMMKSGMMPGGMMPGGASAMPEGIVPPGPAADLTWSLPKGWKESPNKSSMRLATFTDGNGAQGIECSIVSLGGSAGGLNENIRRWMGQVNLKDISDSELNAFIAKQEKITTQDNFATMIVDLTQLQSDSENTNPSIVAAIIEMEDKTVFVKMTGQRGALTKNRSKFKELCQSLNGK